MQSQTLVDRLEEHIKHGDHLCVICNSRSERLEAAAQYISDGLARGEKVVYAADAETTGALQRMLEEEGVNVDDALRNGALAFPTANEAYLRNGIFDPELIYNEFDQTITDALEAGFSGCRFAGEPVWAIDRAELRPGLVEFERRLNELFRDRKAAGLCVYERDAWPAELVQDVLRTHPVAVVGNLVCSRNPYYQFPDLSQHDPKPDSGSNAHLNRMIDRLRELRLQESRLQVALEAGQLGSWELDLKTDTAERTLRHDRIFGYDRLLPSWGYERFLKHVLEEDRERVDAAFREARSTGTTWRFECRIRRYNDDQIRWIEGHGRPEPLGARGDAIESMLGIVADITDRKEMEEALRETDRRKDEFLATLAHELRNPLAPIINTLHLMERKADADPELSELHAVMSRQTNHLTRLVDDLLEVSRISTGRIVLDQKTLDLREVLRGAVDSSQSLIKEAGHVLTVHLPDEPIWVQGDLVRLSQVFLNILNNAVKYTPAAGRITLSASQDEGQVRVKIQDNGIGISDELLPSVFEMFVQGRTQGEQTQAGLGVGLPLARQLAQLHNGAVTATSAGPGQGSEFVVTLPLVESVKPPEGGPSAGLDSHHTGEERVLVVDDNVDAADSLSLSLELQGHEVQCGYTGAAALELVDEFQPHAVLLDIGLPDIDGYEVARRIRQLYPELVLIALTGWGQEKDRTLARAAGFDLHRTKPVSPLQLATDIRDLCKPRESASVPQD